MIRLNAKMTSAINKVQEIFKGLDSLKNMDILVGIPEEKSERDGENSEITNAELAFIHSRGARSHKMRNHMDKSIKKGLTYNAAHTAYLKTHGSPAMAIPARPFLEPAIDEKKKPIGDKIKKSIELALDGQTEEAERQLELAGQMGASAAKEYINDGTNLLPNAPSTIRKKRKKANVII